LQNGAQQGITDAMNDMPSQPGLSSLSGIEAAAYTFGLTDTPHPSLPELISALQVFITGGDLAGTSADLLASPTATADALTGVAATDPADLLPGLDTAIDFVNTLP
jgi:hypothetical protein